MKKFIQELQRRNVIKAALAYMVFAWVIIQVSSIVLPIFGASVNVVRIIIFVLVIAFPFWIILSWIYEITPEGLRKTLVVDPNASEVKKTDIKIKSIIICALAIVIVFLVFNMVSQDQVGSETISNGETLSLKSTDKSIAVLAFVDMSKEKDQEYFSDGISEEILNLLTKIPNLKVISRTSSFSYKGKEQNVKKIGVELHVAHVLEGSIRKSGNTFRITAQLIDATSGTDIWSETFDRSMEDIFKIQDEIAAKVTQKLKVTLMGSAQISTRVDTEAYTLFLKGKQLRNQNSVESNANAFKLIRESIAIDSSYAPAWNTLSTLYYDAAFQFGTMKIGDAIKKSKNAAKKSIALDPKDVEGYLILAALENASWNFKQGSELIEKAKLLNPNAPMVIQSESSFASTIGKKNLAIELRLKTMELDPLNESNNYSLGFYYWMDGQFLKAEESLNEFLLLHPNLGLANGFMGEIQLSLGHPEKALEFITKDSDPFWNLYRKSMAVYAEGNKLEANKLLKLLIKDWGKDSWPNIAHVYAFRGDKDNAFKWLDLAFEQRDGSLLEILNYPEMETLWGDPRWNLLINKLGLPKNHGFHLD